MIVTAIQGNYLLEETLSHLRPQQRLPERYQQRALDVKLACKLTHVYGKYHLAMLHRELAMSEERSIYQPTERKAAMIHQIIIFHFLPSDVLHTLSEHADASDTN